MVEKLPHRDVRIDRVQVEIQQFSDRILEPELSFFDEPEDRGGNKYLSRGGACEFRIHPVRPLVFEIGKSRDFFIEHFFPAHHEDISPESFGGKQISRDGFNLSLQGTGGIQMNLTKRLGIYVEPQVMWRIPTGDSALDTYRSEHPLMFSAATGVRITIGN